MGGTKSMKDGCQYPIGEGMSPKMAVSRSKRLEWGGVGRDSGLGRTWRIEKELGCAKMSDQVLIASGEDGIVASDVYGREKYWGVERKSFGTIVA